MAAPEPVRLERLERLDGELERYFAHGADRIDAARANPQDLRWAYEETFDVRTRRQLTLCLLDTLEGWVQGAAWPPQHPASCAHDGRGRQILFHTTDRLLHVGVAGAPRLQLDYQRPDGA